MNVVVVGDICALLGRGDELGELLRETQERARYASVGFARYQERVGEFLARPSEVRLHRVSQTLQLGDPGPMDPRRAD